eukprot:s1452_g7.t1
MPVSSASSSGAVEHGHFLLQALAELLGVKPKDAQFAREFENADLVKVDTTVVSAFLNGVLVRRGVNHWEKAYLLLLQGFHGRVHVLLELAPRDLVFHELALDTGNHELAFRIIQPPRREILQAFFGLLL